MSPADFRDPREDASRRRIRLQWSCLYRLTTAQVVRVSVQQSTKKTPNSKSSHIGIASND